MAYIEMINSCKTYHMGGSTIYANRDVSFSVERANSPSSLALPAPENPRC